MDFSNKEVNDAYEPTDAKTDVHIKGFGYHGPLSRISPAIAKKLVATGDANIKEKTPAIVPAKPKSATS